MHIVTAGGRWGDGKHKGGFFMRILLLGNSFTSSHHLPQKLAALTGGQVVAHTRGGARLSEQLNPKTALGARTQAALQHEKWDFVVLQEMSHAPLTTPERFFQSVKQLCEQIRANGATPVLFATWAYQKDSKKLAAKGWDYDEIPGFVGCLFPGRPGKRRCMCRRRAAVLCKGRYCIPVRYRRRPSQRGGRSTSGRNPSSRDTDCHQRKNAGAFTQPAGPIP